LGGIAPDEKESAMIQKLRLQTFKNLRDTTLALGDFTLLVGTNASGKSNLRDAFRFLHGVSRAYTLAEIIGEKWIEGGSQVWKGIRGGTRESTYQGAATFTIEASLATRSDAVTYTYKITVDVGANGKPPKVVNESLYLGSEMVFDSHPSDDPPAQGEPQYIYVRLPRDAKNRKHGKRLQFIAGQPVLSQASDNRDATAKLKAWTDRVMEIFGSMRFLDLTPDAMRIPSLPGQDILGDRGENLSSVLQAICDNDQAKKAVLEWIKELTPMDVVDFEFVPDQTGKILVSLVEPGSQKTSAYSASDGTLRFLAIIAALLGPRSARFYFVEELENGIHPTRLHLLLQLMEQKVSQGKIQVVATSHSPQLLGFLSEKSRENAALVYRLSNHPDARVCRILGIPEARRVLQQQNLSRLHSSGWLEDAVAFLEAEEVPA
jgi:predicted ATPase